MTEVVLVTGSSGFLGQHIVKLLQEQDNSVKEIVLLDIKKYENNLGHKTDKLMRVIVGDIRDAEVVAKACTGVDCVIHTAALVDVSENADKKAIELVNVQGTQNVIDACIQRNVRRLIFTSTVDVVISNEHIFYGSEITTPIPKWFLFGTYAETKYKSEEMVIEANGKALADDKNKLLTLALRPTVLYGEEDKIFVTEALRVAHSRNGLLIRVRSIDERMQTTYVGNAAWAHLKAKDKLAQDETAAGEVYYITDDTPITDVFEFYQQFLKLHGFRVSSYTLPYFLLIIILMLLSFFVRLIKPIWSVPWKLPNPAHITYLCTTIFFNRAKATLRLSYTPLYSPEAALEQSLKYYRDVKYC